MYEDEIASEAQAAADVVTMVFLGGGACVILFGLAVIVFLLIVFRKVMARSTGQQDRLEAMLSRQEANTERAGALLSQYEKLGERIDRFLTDVESRKGG